MVEAEPTTNPLSNQETSLNVPQNISGIISNIICIVNHEKPINEEEVKVPSQAVQEKSNNTNEQKEKRHRRSKNDPVGRKYICDICSKSYLSAPALSSHRKTKHFQNEEKKGRGRPRKYPISTVQNEKERTFYLNFFNEEERKRKEGEEFPLNETVLDALKGLKEKDKEQGDEKEINLYKLVIASETPIDLQSADDAFSRYIKEFYASCSKRYFEILVKFIVLFREFINEKNNEVVNTSSDTHNVFSIKDGASKLPEYCNEFVSEFLEKRKEIEIKDSIDLIQHFCFWLHENKYTKSVLSLLTNN